MDSALFILTDPKCGERFARVIADLRDVGLETATLLYVLEPSRKGDPFLDEVAAWGRRFEAAGLRRVSVALKRGDPAAWVRELSRLAPRPWVIASTPRSAPEGFLRPTSPWRNLEVPVLLLPTPASERRARLFDRVWVGLKNPAEDRSFVEEVLRGLPRARTWHGVHIRTAPGAWRPSKDYPIAVSVIAGDRYDIADNLLDSSRQGATLLVLFAQPVDGDRTLPAGYVIEAVVRETEIPVLLWPGMNRTPTPAPDA